MHRYDGCTTSRNLKVDWHDGLLNSRLTIIQFHIALALNIKMQMASLDYLLYIHLLTSLTIFTPTFWIPPKFTIRLTYRKSLNDFVRILLFRMVNYTKWLMVLKSFTLLHQLKLN